MPAPDASRSCKACVAAGIPRLQLSAGLGHSFLKVYEIGGTNYAVEIALGANGGFVTFFIPFSGGWRSGPGAEETFMFSPLASQKKPAM